jgi:hypothetical protein
MAAVLPKNAGFNFYINQYLKVGFHNNIYKLVQLEF